MFFFMDKHNFSSVSSQPDFVSQEEQLLSYWYESGVVEDYIKKNKGSGKRFSFIDGPITANNPMGVHHAWGRTYKDLWQRYYNMRGFEQRFQNGFDNQGLWVEVNVEKQLGFNNKKDIEKFGIEKFVEACKEATRKWAGVQTEQSKRLGMFMDWANSYYTMSDENNYMVWAFLKKAHQQGWVYKGHDSVPWCPRCGTAISQHEILTEEYQELTHKSVYLMYPLMGHKNEYLLVWTTTPWTLPANVAVAVNPKLNYLKVEQAGKIFYIVEGRESALLSDYKVVGKIKGQKMKGWTYEGPYDHLPAVKKAIGDYTHRVVLAEDFVTAEEGTGLVHIAPGAGEEDFELGKVEKLPVISPIDEAGYYYDGFEYLTGQTAKDNPDLVLDDLGKRGYSYQTELYKHRYPVCWRCKTELVWRVVDEWYIGMDELRGQIAENVKNVNWIPKFGLERELDWLKNMHDWMISKQRYWGLALPIWVCEKCQHFEVLGSFAELKDRAVGGWDKFEGHSPHRPWVDQVKIKCDKCGGMSHRIKDVGNPWLDAGIVPFSTLNYRTDKSYWKKWYPADFITESFPGQFKNWFYSLLTMATVLDNSNPFKTVLGFATLLDEDGSEMHKSKGNSISFDEAATKVGADTMRWVYVRHNPENNLLFGYHTMENARRNFLLILWNVYKFFLDYALLDGYEPKPIKSGNVLDKWLDSRFNETTLQINTSLVKYDPMHASEALESLVQDFSTWWLRRSRDRMGPWVEDLTDKNQAYATFYTNLVRLTKLLAPFIPFISDNMYRNLTGERSVHLADWPEEGQIDQKLLSDMRIARNIVELAHSLRKEHGLKLRQPLASLSYTFGGRLPDEIEEIVTKEVNVKEIFYNNNNEPSPVVSLDFVLTPGLELEGEARELIRQIQDERKKLNLDRSAKVHLSLPSIPEGWKEEVAKATQASKITLGQEFKIEPS